MSHLALSDLDSVSNLSVYYDLAKEELSSKDVLLSPGQTLEMHLEEHPSSGYMWSFTDIKISPQIKDLGYSHLGPQNSYGSKGLHHFSFAPSLGVHRIHAVMWRPESKKIRSSFDLMVRCGREVPCAE